MENSSELKLDFHSITRFSSSPFKTTFENISDIQVHSLVSLPGESRVSLLKHLAHSHFLHSKKICQACDRVSILFSIINLA